MLAVDCLNTLRQLGACLDARDWVATLPEGTTAKEAWDTCQVEWCFFLLTHQAIWTQVNESDYIRLMFKLVALGVDAWEKVAVDPDLFGFPRAIMEEAREAFEAGRRLQPTSDRELDAILARMSDGAERDALRSVRRFLSVLMVNNLGHALSDLETDTYALVEYDYYQIEVGRIVRETIKWSEVAEALTHATARNVTLQPREKR